MSVITVHKAPGGVERLYRSTPFSTRSYPFQVKPGCWNHQRVEVWRGDVQVGKYTYGYSAGTPFYPFQASDGRWFALYAGKNYTESRVACLENGFEDWCGLTRTEDEERRFKGGGGFCPVDFYVPRYQEWQWFCDHDYRNGQKVDPYREEERHYTWDNHEAEWRRPFAASSVEDSCDEKLLGEGNTAFGFVSGCVWGDDQSWKIQYVDLSRVLEKRLIQDERFGYIHLPRRLALDEAVEVDYWWMEGNGLVRTSIEMTHTSHFWTDGPGHWQSE